MNYKVSVAIPIYNVEKYIERCARSLFEQTLDNIEFIFVDDCSSDRSVEILKNTIEEYSKRKRHCKIISLPENRGLGNARTVGIKSASGKYMIHCDSDDWVDLDLYEKMYCLAEKESADIVVCDCIEEYANRSVISANPQFSSDPKEVIANAYKYIFMGSMCNKLVKRTLHIDNNIFSYPGIAMAEDLAVMCRLFVNADKLCQVRSSCYHYFKENESSITASKYNNNNIDQMLKVSGLLRDYLLSKNAEKYELYANFICYSSRLQIIRGNFSDIEKFRKTYPETNKYIKSFSSKGFPPKARLRYWLVKNHLAFLSILLYKLFIIKKRFI